MVYGISYAYINYGLSLSLYLNLLSPNPNSNSCFLIKIVKIFIKKHFFEVNLHAESEKKNCKCIRCA